MAMRKIIMIYICIIYASFCIAQNESNTKSLSDMNAIKGNTSYIYAESTMQDAVEALSGAKAILELKVSDWIRSSYPNEKLETCLAKLNEHMKSLKSKRGKYNRVLVFIEKEQIVSAPIINDSSSSIQQIGTVKPLLNTELTSIEENMKSVSKFSAIETFIGKLKEEGSLNAYGKYASLPEEASCHLFVYDKDGIIVAVLRQSEDGSFFNLRTKEVDNVRNYKNCGAIWFQLK